jgi:hypothetical protein
VALRMKMLPSTAKPLAENAVLLTGRTRLRYCGILLLPPMVTKIGLLRQAPEPRLVVTEQSCP